jgi:hypothetical protein
LEAMMTPEQIRKDMEKVALRLKIIALKMRCDRVIAECDAKLALRHA